MKTTGSRVIRGVVFLAGLLVLLMLCSLVLRPKNNTEEDGIREPAVYGVLGEPKDSIDVLILGDSLAECAVSPMSIWRDYGITGYDCSTGNQKLFLSMELMQTVFENQSPKMVLLEANTIYSTCPKTDILSNRVENLLPVIRYHDRWKTLNRNDWFGTVNYTHREANKGFHISVDVKPSDAGNYMKHSKKTAPIRSENVEYVEKILAFCREKGAELVLFSAPSSYNWNYKQHRGITELAERLDVPYVDLNLMTEELGIDWSQDTMDWGNHMNCAGAEKVSAWLGSYLAETGLFADKRNTPEFAAWNEDLREFEAAVAAAVPTE